MAARGVDSLGAPAPFARFFNGQSRVARLLSRLLRYKPILLTQRAVADFMEDKCATQAAALAFYSLFSLPALLVIAFGIAGTFADPIAIEGRFHQQLGNLIGTEGADQILEILRVARRETNAAGLLPTVVAVIVLLFGATRAFGQLQSALNQTWEVEDTPQSGLKRQLSRRLVSFVMIVGVALLMWGSLLLSTLLAAFDDVLGRTASPVGPLAVQLLDLGVSLLGIWIALSVIFRFVPDATVTTREAMTGAAVTSVLFVIGKFGMGLYLGNSNLTTSYGAAGALVVLLIWVYFSAIVVLLGAEVAQASRELSVTSSVGSAESDCRPRSPSAERRSFIVPAAGHRRE